MGTSAKDSAILSKEYRKEKKKQESEPYTWHNAISGSTTLHQTENYAVVYKGFGEDKSLVVLEREEKIDSATGQKRVEWNEIESAKLDKDTRVSWDTGKPKMSQGSAALTHGELKGSGEHDILVRVSDVTVVAGKNSTVFNFAKNSGGTFSGGSNVTYRGSYVDSTFSDNHGLTTFGGYFKNSTFDLKESSAVSVFSGVFEDMEIEAGSGNDIFSGFFSNVRAIGGNGADIFSGFFLANSLLEGGEGDDQFNGRYFGSKLNGGKGNDRYGANLALSSDKSVIFMDVVQSSIEDTEGDNSFDASAQNSTIQFGNGNNSVRGVITGSEITTGSGDDTFSIMYSKMSNLDAGDGDDNMTLGTVIGGEITAGEGMNTVTLGLNKDAGKKGGELFGGNLRVAESRWVDMATSATDSPHSTQFGEVQNTTVDAQTGETSVLFHNGLNTQSVFAGSANPETQTEQGDAAHAKGEKKDTSLNRFAVVDSDGGLKEGQAGVNIVTGTGDVALKSLERQREDEKNDTLINYTPQRQRGVHYRTISSKDTGIEASL